MSINCSFKLAYTCLSFTKRIDNSISTQQLKNLIKNDVLTNMNVNNFEIILAGTDRSEENDPLDCSTDNITLQSLLRNYNNNSCAFYIKELDYEETPDSIINTHIYNTECPVCYSTLRPIETIRLGCHHQICRNCISSWFRTGVSTCPFCRA